MAVTRRSASPRSTPPRLADSRLLLTASSQLSQLVEFLGVQRQLGRLPLFIVGAGISRSVVPLLLDIGAWFQKELQQAQSVPDEWLITHAAAIAANDATRRQAAEFFSAVQDKRPAMCELWKKFSSAFLTDGFQAQIENIRFPGLSQNPEPTSAHESLARLVHTHRSEVLSLNFDGLTRRALQRLGNALSLNNPFSKTPAFKNARITFSTRVSGTR